ncbi:AAA family ATPase [Nostoc sp. 'Peltigera malacea cyanobiont' DB3992]|uniref:AAA family ATPase n=1 Tax=Nostoc sp. 'Peltigera malacea cyanobiont' DB3992 TaxID=1206980 RepID=UPI000C040FC5|nr:ATP-binding protein [Nostoc sp. 'Peltigera malacea cyanobiont' DB3992]PHM09399.1 ATPase [Nostoc sp. 'Peltigera malacea cyanobiont' DB3992]
MLKQLILENWKSFRYAELPLDPLTVLIGTNASGKSNVVEALEFLQRIARGENIEAALAGDKTLPSIRGGVEWAAKNGEKEFTLKILVADNDGKVDYLYRITLKTKPTINSLTERITIFQDDHEYFPIEFGLSGDKFSARSSLLNRNDFYGLPLYFIESNFLSEPSKKESYQSNYFKKNSVKIINNIILPTIENILVLNPVPYKMRDYSRLSDKLESDGSNIAGVLAALDGEQKAKVESTLSAYIKDLPEGDIKRVFAEPVGRLKTDAMLYCEEEWKPGEMTLIDAKTMSDGTLHFIAIITALLTRPEGSQLVIEEIDNGLHPSRAGLLVRILREIGSKRKIDILLTTHNPALLDALGPEIVPFVVVAHRDSESGESKLTLLEDIENLPLLLASGTLGKLATKGAIEKSLSDNK